MLQITTSHETQSRLDELDEEWERELIPRLPLPIAYVVNRMQQESPAWELLLKDSLNTLLRYLALLGASEYLAGLEPPDFDVNDALKNMGRVMSEGQWLTLARVCAARKAGSRRLPELASSFMRLDRDLTVRLTFERYGLRTEQIGALSALVAARNKLFAHGVSLEPAEKQAASGQLRRLLRLALDALDPVWRYELCASVPVAKKRQCFALKGIVDFMPVAPPDGVGQDESFVRLPDDGFLVLHPLTVSDQARKTGPGPLLDSSAEVYLLNYLERAQVPVFLGLRGSSTKRPDLSEHLGALLNQKNVWATRQDIQIDEVLSYASRKTRESLDYFEWNNLYDASRHLKRAALTPVLDEFISHPDSRLLFIAGRSGCGKTASVINWATKLLENGIPAYVLRAVEIPARESSTGLRLANWLCGQLGYAGKLEDILERAATSPSRRFVLIFEGLNEFAAKGRNLDGLWRAINDFAEAHKHLGSLKIIVTTRVDDETPSVFFPKGLVPEFSDERLFHRIEGKPWFMLTGFTNEEILAALKIYGVESEQARTVLEKAGRALSNPNLLARYAEGVLSGADIRRMGAQG